MAQDFDQLLEIISDEVATLHAVFNVCRDLQPLTDPQNREQSVASFALSAVVLALEDDVVLRIFRLCEQPGKKAAKKKAKLVLQSLIDSLPADRSAQRSDLISSLAALQKVARPLDRHRNERIGHFNRQFATGQRPLPSISLELVENALRLVRAFMRHLLPNMHYEGPFVVGGGSALMAALSDALRMQELRLMAWDDAVSPAQIRDELRTRRSG